ncbi:MAG: sulfurtransferase [Verrucomicrobia bacterium]|nr:sulfurtransferase [Verrucomicrobiota bacterium]
MNTDFSTESIDVITAAERMAKAPDNTLLLDVREQQEWDFCHVTGALHIPMQQVPDQLQAIPKDENVLVLCHHGGRSLRVTRFLRSQGYTKVQNVAGGIEQWAIQVNQALPRY